MSTNGPGDIRLYTYEGYSILRKWHINKQHRSKSVSEAMAKIKHLRTMRRYNNTQFILIDYNIDKIIYINNPPDEKKIQDTET